MTNTMASASVSQFEFSCPICLELLKDPVTVACGHSFCLSCITGCWDQEDQKGVYSCPQCRETFTPRPVLRRNTMLTEVIEKLKKTELQSDITVSSDAEPGDVECDFCTGRKHKAIKSCLTCMVSYCEAHIQPHYEVPRLSKHKLVNATTQLQERICSQHDRIIEAFCRTDRKLVCMLCSMDDHNGHKTVSAAAERTEKQKTLLQMKGDNQSQIQQKEKEVEEVKQALESLQEAVEDAELIFTELISFMEQKRSEVTELIRAQERAEVGRAEGLLEQLELEITKLKSRDVDVEKLQSVEDPVDFIQGFQSHFADPYVAKALPQVTFEPQFSFKEMIKPVVPSLRDKTNKFYLAIHKVTGFMKGDMVKLKTPETISKSLFGSKCGYKHKYKITVGGVGVVSGKTGGSRWFQKYRTGDYEVNFPEDPDWCGSSSKLDLVLAIN